MASLGVGRLRKCLGVLSGGHPHRVVDRLQRRFAKEPRRVPGRLQALGWDIEYVDGLALVSSLDVLVARGWNDFIPMGQRPVILDCGANIGISALHYKRLFPGARITAFEPDPEITPLLRRNLARNGAGDVMVVEAAVWTEEGVSRFLCDGADGSRLIHEEDPSSRSVLVRTIALTNYLAQPVDLVKMDIEGAELQVIPALENRLSGVQNMIVECHLSSGDAQAFGGLLQALARAGFLVSLNSYGAWRDLVRRPEKQPYEFDQYVLVAAWRAA